MTDKQIIIDGIDVSGCYQYMPRYMEDYDIDTLDYCRYYFKPCKDVDVKYCYYKQLKRKEQEVQQAMDNYVQLDLQRVKEYNELVGLYKAKEQECEELKEEIKTNGFGCFNIEMSEQLDQLKAENEKLKQTLTEIKEICKAESYLSPQSTRLLVHDILQKISECEVNNDR